jgi:chromatin remodeling complex protein RSC6
MAEKKASEKKATEKKAKGGPANSSFMKPVQPDAALAAVIGSDPQPRTEITKKIWDYIKSNNLQDPANKRMIRADDKLKAVFGGKAEVSMFEMTKLLNGHLK